MSATQAQDATGVANRSASSNKYDRIFPTSNIGNPKRKYQKNHIGDKYAIFKKPAKMRLLSTDLPATGPSTGENQ